MITRERNSGRALPSVLSKDLGYSFSFRIADTQGVKNSTTNWIYYELPASAVISRQRSASLDQFSQQVSITVLEDALPDGFAILPYLVLEIDIVDSMGYQWPYHTGPIDSINESYELVGGAVKRLLDISSFGVIQFAKDAYSPNQWWSPETTSYTGYLTVYGTVRHYKYTGTGGLPTRNIAGAFNTIDCTDTTVAGYHGFVVSTNSDFSAPKVQGVDYRISDSAGVALNPATSKNAPLYITWLTAEPASTIYIKFWQADYLAVANIDGTTRPQTMRLPDYGVSYQSGGKPAVKRDLWDDFATQITAATTTTLTPADTGMYIELGTNNPSSGWTEYVEWTSSTGVREVRTVSAINSVTGVVTVTSAFSSTPQVGDIMRIVTTRPHAAYQKFNQIDSITGAYVPVFRKVAAGSTYPRGAFEHKPSQGVIVPKNIFHFTRTALANAAVHITNLILLDMTTVPLFPFSDNMVENLVRTNLLSYIPGTIYSGRSDWGASWYGKHSATNAFTNNLFAQNNTVGDMLQMIADNGFPPNGKLIDRADGSVLVAAFKQQSTPEYTLSNIISVRKNFVAEPPTAVGVISKFPESHRLSVGGHFQASFSGWTSGTEYLFDGSDAPDPTNSGTDFAFATVTAGSTSYVTIELPWFGPIVNDPVDKIVIKGLTGVVDAQFYVESLGSYAGQFYFWGGERKIVTQNESVELTSEEIKDAYQIINAYNLWRKTVYKPVIVLTFNDTDLVTGVTMVPRITEIEVWGSYNAAWTAMLTDDLSATGDVTASPSNWTNVSSVTNTGPSFWKRTPQSNMSFKYMSPSTFKRITPLYDVDWYDCKPRYMAINQTRISITDCKNIAERYLNEAVIKSNTYSVTAIMDPRVDLGDTVSVSLPDGSVLDLMVYSYSDSGGADDMTCTYELVDYSGIG